MSPHQEEVTAGFYEKLLQAKKGIAVSGHPTYPVPLPWRALKTELRASTAVPVCRVKKGKVKDLVVVITPVEARLGEQKLVNMRKQLDVPTQRNKPRLQHEKSNLYLDEDVSVM